MSNIRFLGKVYGCVVDDNGGERVLGLDNSDDALYEPEYWAVLKGMEIVARFIDRDDAEMFVRIKNSGHAVRNFDPKKEIAVVWSIEDVKNGDVRPDLTDEQAMEVLYNAEREHDAEMGISWDTLRCWADILFPDHGGFDCDGNCASCRDTSHCEPEMVKRRIEQGGGH